MQLKYIAVGCTAKRLSFGNQFITSVVDYLEERSLQVSPEKSTITLFTPDTNQAKYKPVVHIKRKPVKLDTDPKVLGIHFNTMHTFTSHINKTATKAKKKLNVLKALAAGLIGAKTNKL